MRAFYAFRGAPYRYGELEPLEVSQLETGRQLRFHHPQADVDRTSPNYVEMTRKGASTRSGLVWSGLSGDAIRFRPASLPLPPQTQTRNMPS